MTYAPGALAFLYIGRSVRAVADVQHNIDLVEAADIYVNKALVGSDGLLVRAVKNVVEQNGEVAVRKKRKVDTANIAAEFYLRICAQVRVTAPIAPESYTEST